eukprot:COSAG06_NODE_21376_length_759_cov_1.053030_1_plen_114_part_01
MGGYGGVLWQLERLALRVLLSPSSSAAGQGALKPTQMVLHVRTIGRQFRRGRQEDAHEFLRCLLDSMQAGCLKHHQLGSGATKLPRRVQETSAVHALFGGHTRSQIRCLRCGYC